MKCGKNDCEKPHGPYYYAYWKERIFIDDDKSATSEVVKDKASECFRGANSHYSQFLLPAPSLALFRNI